DQHVAGADAGQRADGGQDVVLDLGVAQVAADQRGGAAGALAELHRAGGRVDLQGQLRVDLDLGRWHRGDQHALVDVGGEVGHFQRQLVDGDELGQAGGRLHAGVLVRRVRHVGHQGGREVDVAQAQAEAVGGVVAVGVDADEGV